MTEPRRAAAKRPAARPAPAVAPAASAAPHRHPNLGLAPADMSAGFPQAAELLRHDAMAIATRALESALAGDLGMRPRYDELGLRRLLRDAELIVERLAMCVAGDDPRWLAEYAEWVVPIYRRRRVTLLDIVALCDGIEVAIGSILPADALPSAQRSLAAATAVLRRDARLGGDTHKRNALWKWLYRGV